MFGSADAWKCFTLDHIFTCAYQVPMYKQSKLGSQCLVVFVVCSVSRASMAVSWPSNAVANLRDRACSLFPFRKPAGIPRQRDISSSPHLGPELLHLVSRVRSIVPAPQPSLFFNSSSLLHHGQRVQKLHPASHQRFPAFCMPVSWLSSGCLRSGATSVHQPTQELCFPRQRCREGVRL